MTPDVIVGLAGLVGLVMGWTHQSREARRLVMGWTHQERRRIVGHAQLRAVNPPVITPDPDHAPPGMECVIIQDIALMNNRSMLTALSASGPVDIDYMLDRSAYRITGPDIERRLERLMRCVDPPMTATEAVQRRDALLNTDELNILPGALTYFNAGEFHSLMGPRISSEEVEKKAKIVLWVCLDDRQREDVFLTNRFSVKGSKGTYIYEIRKLHQGNVHRDDGRRYCLTLSELPVWDLMLAQKLMIEDNEPKFLKMANRLDEDPGPTGRPDPPRIGDGSLY